MKRPGPRKPSAEERSRLDLERENELLKCHRQELQQKVEFLLEELRVAHETIRASMNNQQTLARRASWGNGYQQ